MNPIKIVLLFAAALFACAFLPGLARAAAPVVREKARVFFAGLDGLQEGNLHLANVAEGTHIRSLTRYSDAAIATRHLLFKTGSDADHVAVTGAAEEPLGTVPDEASAAEERVQVELLGIGPETRLMIASENIAAGVNVFTAASGKIQDEPAVAGTYWLVGRSLTAVTDYANSPKIEVLPCKPIKLVVIAALTAPVTAAGSDAGTTQTLANACKADLLAIDNALASPAILKVI